MEEPKGKLNTQDINIDKMPEPAEAAKLKGDLLVQKKTIRLYQMVWSGVTKYLRRVSLDHHKSIEFPLLGVFMPQQVCNDANSDRLTEASLNKFSTPGEIETKFLLFKFFLDGCGSSAKISKEGN